MSETNNNHSSKQIRGVVIFIIIALFIQLLAVLFLTTSGLGVMYPYLLYMNSKKISIGDNNISEYFPMSDDISDSDMIILSVDTGVADSYRLAGDYLQYISKITEISSVAVYLENMRISGISNAAVSGIYSDFSEACNRQREQEIVPNQLLTFMEKIYSLNLNRPSDAKTSIIGIKGNTSFKGVISSLTGDLYTSPGGYTGEHLEVLDAKTEDEYIRLFKKHKDAIKEVLGSKFERHLEYYEYIVNGTLKESISIKNLLRLAPSENGAVYAVLPEEFCTEDSPFLKMARENYNKVTVTRTVYYNSKSLADKDSEPVVKSEGFFPGKSNEFRIMYDNSLTWFRRYFAKVSNNFMSEKLSSRMDFIGETGENTYFIICSSKSVTFGNEEKNKNTAEVVVAPG